MTSIKKVIYVSGATGLLGREVSKYLFEKGFNLLLGGRNKLELAKLAGEYSNIFKEQVVGFVNCDLSKPDSWEDVFLTFEENEFSGYVNCSGVQGPIGPITDIDIQDYSQVFNVNLISAIFFTKYFLSRKNKSDELSIIHFSGGGAASPRPQFSPYSLSKTALVRFVENVASECPNIQTKINVIAPGILPSQMQTQILQSAILKGSKEHESASNSLIGRMAVDPRLLELIVFLMTDVSRGITGKLISAKWDNWSVWPKHLDDLEGSELYTLRRITARDRGHSWGDF